MVQLGLAKPDVGAAPGAVRIDGLRDVRYGEVFLVRGMENGFVAEVWNTLGLNDCPQDSWDELDRTAIASEHGALIAILNGPRHWLLDAIENVPPADRRVTTFGSIDMFLAASLDLGGDLPTPTPYTERKVRRNTVWEWSAGRTVHELVTATGDRYVMQAYCLAVDPELTEPALVDIAPHLDLPRGWKFESRQLSEPLRVSARDGVGVVEQDDLHNTYHLR
jgi:hypothetical protein